MERDAGVACPPAARLNHRSWPPPGMGIEPDRTEPACIGRDCPSCDPSCEAPSKLCCCVCGGGMRANVSRQAANKGKYALWRALPAVPSPGRIGLRLGGSGGLSDGCYRATVKSAGGCPSCILATPSWSNLAPLRRGFFVRPVGPSPLWALFCSGGGSGHLLQPVALLIPRNLGLRPAVGPSCARRRHHAALCAPPSPSVGCSVLTGKGGLRSPGLPPLGSAAAGMWQRWWVGTAQPGRRRGGGGRFPSDRKTTRIVQGAAGAAFEPFYSYPDEIRRAADTPRPEGTVGEYFQQVFSFTDAASARGFPARKFARAGVSGPRCGGCGQAIGRRRPLPAPPGLQPVHFIIAFRETDIL
jgi:hypothetical protein